MTKPRIEVSSSGPESIRAITRAIDSRILPDVYVTNGYVVHVERISGAVAAVAGDDDAPLPVTASVLNSANLAALLAEYTYTYATRSRKDSAGKTETYEVECTPHGASLSAALARKTWPGLQPLHGIVGAPVLRRDGTLLQVPGYDEATGLYLTTRVALPQVPDRPTARQVRAAKDFLIGKFLRDFPWKEDADRANYLGVLATPILARYLHSLIPFVVFTATMPGSGKTILTSGPGMLYGQRVLTWTDSNDELRKSITSVLADACGAVIFDNLAEGSVIDSPVLARLITERTWNDRLLGKNTTTAYANDRLWCATGNNLRLGGDMASRTVVIQLDPKTPRPEQRTGFAIPNLDQWILNPANQQQVLWHLLILVIDWTRHGAPRAHRVAMRQFTPWAEAIGGFLTHHGIEGFLANAETAHDIDEEDAMWTAFLAQCRKVHGDAWKTTAELIHSADPAGLGSQWDGLFITDDRGRPYSPKALGMRLTGHVGRWHGNFRLLSDTDKHTKSKRWRVVESDG